MNEKLQKYLSENVISPPTPEIIILSNFKFDIREFKGSFKITLDNLSYISDFNFSADITGRYGIHVPLYISPLSVPASYPSIDLTADTEEGIENLINQNFPKLKPFGLNRETGEMIDRQTKLEVRIIDKNQVALIINKIKMKDFELKINLKIN